MNALKFNLRDTLTSCSLVIAVAVVSVSIWHGAVKFLDLPKALLPTPGQCLQGAFDHRDALLMGTYSTGVAAIAGLLVAVLIGSTIAIAFSQSRNLRLAFFPYVILLQTVPIVAVAPLLIIWSGYTFRTVVIVTVIVCLFPIVNSMTTGLMAIERDMSALFRLYGASRWKRLVRLQLPAAIKHLMLGAKTSSALAVIGAIVAEFFVGNGTNYDGLGTLMTGWQAMVKTDALIAALFASAILGLALFGTVQLLSVTTFRRWTQN
jgi:NitT/TauT family transport system permease protein